MGNRIMLGLWRYVINLPQVLIDSQMKKTAKRFEKRYGKMPDEVRKIHHFVVKNLATTGNPLGSRFMSEELDMAEGQVVKALDFLEKKLTYLYRNHACEVTWAYPVTVDKTPHKIEFSTGETLYAA